jgi:hypothetical protein
MRRALRMLSTPVRYVAAFGYGAFILAEIVWSLAMLAMLPPGKETKR